MRILFVAHGYPPRETAGTERHVEALAQHARAKGHNVHVVAATRSAGHRPYETWTEAVDGVPVTRLVNNVPTRALGRCEADGAVDRVMAGVLAQVRPDVVHLHHLQFLSSSTRWPVPVVVTLHDQWFWCAAGGLGLLPDGTVCEGPSPATCAPCSQAWRPGPGRLTRWLARTAGVLAPVVSPGRLDRLWRAVPARIRPTPERGRGPEPPAPDAARRNARMAAVLEAAHTVVSPSRYLAGQCLQATGVESVVVPHGLAPPWFAHGTGKPRHGVLFLGTIAAHKGVQHLVHAWRTACPDGSPPLTLHGPVQDASLLDGHPVGPVLTPAGVRAALDRAQVLVVPSVWPENAPLVVLEARARGCPVITTHLGGLPELVGPTDGIQVPAGNVTALADALQTVLTRPPGPPRPPPALDGQADHLLRILAEAAR